MTAREVPKLRVNGMVSCRPTETELRATETELGRALPATYREFASAYGFGRSLGLFLFYVPCEPPVGAAWQETLGGRAHDLLKELAERRRVEDPAGDASDLSSLLPFGVSENGDIIAWATDREADGEWAVVIVPPRSSRPRVVAGSFAELLQRALEPNTGGVLLGAEFSLEPSFEPLPCFG